MANRSYDRGASLERRYATDKTDEGYVAIRAAGSRGAVDVIAVRSDDLIFAQMKTGGTYPFAGFGPDARRQLSELAAQAGARAVLVWRGTRKKNYRVIGEVDWPDDR